MNTINKIGLIIIQDDKILLTRKKGTDKFLMPGGKIRPEESHKKCLDREIIEELGVNIDSDSIKFLVSMEDMAEYETDTLLKMELYIGNIQGIPKAQSEIEEIVWFSKNDNFKKLSRMLEHKIMPHIIYNKYL
ncbi:MAG: NUDIX domain-containing protein [bacterium]